MFSRRVHKKTQMNMGELEHENMTEYKKPQNVDINETHDFHDISKPAPRHCLHVEERLSNLNILETENHRSCEHSYPAADEPRFSDT